MSSVYKRSSILANAVVILMMTILFNVGVVVVEGFLTRPTRTTTTTTNVSSRRFSAYFSCQTKSLLHHHDNDHTGHWNFLRVGGGGGGDGNSMNNQVLLSSTTATSALLVLSGICEKILVLVQTLFGTVKKEMQQLTTTQTLIMGFVFLLGVYMGKSWGFWKRCKLYYGLMIVRLK
jgi:hypothetical protein